MQRKERIDQEKSEIEKAKKLDMFEKYEHFTDLNMRKDFLNGAEK